MNYNTIGDLYYGNTEDRQLIEQHMMCGDVWPFVCKFLKDKNIDMYYIRMWDENEEIWLDYGSWSKFFIFSHKTKEDNI